MSERQVLPSSTPRPAKGGRTAGSDGGAGVGDAARRAAVSGLVLLGIVAVALALWELKLVVALIFLAFVIAAAMRPGIDALARRRVPRGVGVTLHYLALAGLFALFSGLSCLVPSIR